MATTTDAQQAPVPDDADDDVVVIELTPEQAWARFDADVRRRLGISAAEFARRYDAGEYDDPDDALDISWLALIFEGKREFGFHLQ